MRRQRQAERLAARGHALHQQAEVEHARAAPARCAARRTRSRGPVTPIGASSKGCSFSSRACGAWSVATQSIAPDRSASISACAVLLGAQRRVHLEVGVERAHRLVGEQQVVRRGLAGHLGARRLGPLDHLHGLARGHVLHVDAPLLVGGQRAVARHLRRTRTPTGCRPGPSSADTSPSCITPSPDSDGSSSCSASRRPARRWYWSAWRITPAERTGSPSSVKPSRAGVGQLGHLGELLAALAAR